MPGIRHPRNGRAMMNPQIRLCGQDSKREEVLEWIMPGREEL